MDDYDATNLRMQCLELAKQVAIATCSGTYNIVSDAEKYWEFVRGSATSAPPVKSGDDISF